MKIKEVKQLIYKSKYKHYVYAILRKDGRPFYIGKGQEYRLQYHLLEALNTKTKNLKLNIIRGFIKKNTRLEYKIVGFYNSDEYALEVERFLILYYGRIDLRSGILTNLTDGGGPRNCSKQSIEKLSNSIKNFIINNPVKHKSYQKIATKLKREQSHRDLKRQIQLDYIKEFPEEYSATKEKGHKTRRKLKNRKANSERLKKYFKDPKARKKNSEAQIIAHKKKKLVVDRCKKLVEDNNLDIIIPKGFKGIKIFEEFEKILLSLI